MEVEESNQGSEEDGSDGEGSEMEVTSDMDIFDIIKLAKEKEDN